LFFSCSLFWLKIPESHICPGHVLLRLIFPDSISARPFFAPSMLPFQECSVVDCNSFPEPRFFLDFRRASYADVPFFPRQFFCLDHLGSFLPRLGPPPSPCFFFAHNCPPFGTTLLWDGLAPFFLASVPFPLSLSFAGPYERDVSGRR